MSGKRKKPHKPKTQRHQNTGEQLETLVHRLETHLAPEGVTVKQRRREFLPSGTQYAEYDIYITGPVGSSTIRWLISCRDRPSAGAAPRDWINELYGIKVAEQFDKVFAVSTTGFAEPAVELAQRVGIILRTVDHIEDLASAFEVVSLQVGSFHHQVRMVTPLHSDQVIPATAISDQPVDGAHFRLKGAREPKFQYFADFVISHTDPRSVNILGDEPVRFLFSVSGWLDVINRSRFARLHNLRVIVEVIKITNHARVLTARQYAEAERVIARDGELVADTPQGPVTYRIQVFDRPNGQRDIVWSRESGPDSIPPMPRTIITMHDTPQG